MESKKSGKNLAYFEVLGKDVGYFGDMLMDFWRNFPLFYAILRDVTFCLKLFYIILQYCTRIYIILLYFTLMFDSMISYLSLFFGGGVPRGYKGL